MFDRIFGKYLLEAGKLTAEQLSAAYEKQDLNRAKLGLLAVSKKLMSVEQADEVNRLQSIMDKRFGDIAVEKGYLSAEQLSALLGEQGNSYLALIQTILDDGYLTMQQVEDALAVYQKEHGYTDSDIEMLKECDMDNVLHIVMKDIPPKVQNIMGVMLRTMTRLIDSHVYVEKIHCSEYYVAEKVSYQELTGANHVLAALCGNEEAMKSTAKGYMGDNVINDEEDALDSMAELINCVDGLYATQLSREGVAVELEVPKYKLEGVTLRGSNFYIARITVLGKELDYVVSYNESFKLFEKRQEKEGRIFIVDDSRTARKVLRGILETHGYEVVGEAENGRDALAAIVAKEVDLITLDITMPIMDGIETLKQLKLRDIELPVMMVSASAQGEKIMEALKCGACDFLQKPYDENQVVEAIKKVLVSNL